LKALLHLILILKKHLKDYPAPKNLGFLWNFGSLLGIALGLQILTGIFLAMYYTPHIELAFLSIECIMRDVTGGWFLRYLHANVASFFFLFIYLHILKALFYKSYNSYNENLWYSGIFIFLLSMATAFLGYVLPWGQMSLWGATVITNLITAVPGIGQILLIWVWGGFSINNATLNRFFIIHVILPFVITAFILIHIILLHEKGSSSLLGSIILTDKISFFPYYVYKDIFGFFIFLIVLTLFLGFSPNYLVGHSDNYIFANILITPLHIVPEWYFLPYYAILRSIPDKLGGVLSMGLAILIYFFLSTFDFSLVQNIFFRPYHNEFFSFFIFIFYY
jgi:ubiquinol-cytochrome c reductase cytochrome b subunit